MDGNATAASLANVRNVGRPKAGTSRAKDAQWPAIVKVIAMRYELRFMDFGFQVYAGMLLEAADDMAAIAKARVLHATANGAGYQLVRGTQLIHMEIFIVPAA